MKVVIAGAGEVGIHLAKMLSSEDHDIVLVDDSPERLSEVDSDIDFMPVVGSAHLFSDLKQTGISKADLFIAVTPSEERNILSCSLASHLGAERTIARINNAEYLQKVHREKLNSMGVNELIYPESLAAKEIVSSVKQTGTRQIIEFSHGKLLLLGIKVRGDASILNRTFESLAAENENILVVAINRGGETIIPNGSDCIKDDDIVYFITTPMEQLRLFELTAKKTFEVRNIMFLGGSRIAKNTLEKLGEQYRIKVIEENIEKCEQLAERYGNILVINGDCRNLKLLKDEGIEKMDAVIATTNSSEINILGCHLAKTLGVRRTIAEVENLAFMGLAESMNIGSIVNKKLIAASYIYRFTLSAAISKVKCLTSSDAEVFEFIAKKNTRVVQKSIMELDFPDEAKIGGVIRGENGYIAHGNTRIQEGDRVVVFTLPSAVRKLEKFFK